MENKKDDSPVLVGKISLRGYYHSCGNVEEDNRMIEALSDDEKNRIKAYITKTIPDNFSDLPETTEDIRKIPNIQDLFYYDRYRELLYLTGHLCFDPLIDIENQIVKFLYYKYPENKFVFNTISLTSRLDAEKFLYVDDFIYGVTDIRISELLSIFELVKKASNEELAMKTICDIVDMKVSKLLNE